ETEGALVAEAQLEGATDAAVRRALARIAADEARHAALAWAFVAWALREHPSVSRSVARAFASAPETAAPARMEVDRRAHGRVGPDGLARIRAASWQDVVLPCARALLA